MFLFWKIFILRKKKKNNALTSAMWWVFTDVMWLQTPSCLSALELSHPLMTGPQRKSGLKNIYIYYPNQKHILFWKIKYFERRRKRKLKEKEKEHKGTFGSGLGFYSDAINARTRNRKPRWARELPERVQLKSRCAWSLSRNAFPVRAGCRARRSWGGSSRARSPRPRARSSRPWTAPWAATRRRRRASGARRSGSGGNWSSSRRRWRATRRDQRVL